MPTEEFWFLAGLGVFALLSGIGFAFIGNYKPCKHEWEYMNKILEDGYKVADKYRCIHCCKKKEV